ncbi:unnamed protein product [Camellia sinensis]
MNGKREEREKIEDSKGKGRVGFQSLFLCTLRRYGETDSAAVTINGEHSVAAFTRVLDEASDVLLFRDKVYLHPDKSAGGPGTGSDIGLIARDKWRNMGISTAAHSSKEKIRIPRVKAITAGPLTNGQNSASASLIDDDKDGKTAPRAIAQEVSQSNVTNWSKRPAVLRALSQRLSRGFNEALNGFTDEGWSMMENDGMDDVSILVNSSPDKLMGLNLTFSNGFPAVSNAVLCAKASMLLQLLGNDQTYPECNVPPAILFRFLREHRSEWVDSSIDAYSAAAVKVGPCILPRARAGSFGGQVILPLAHILLHEELLEVIKLEDVGHYPEDAIVLRDMFLLQEALKKRHEESLEPGAIPLTQEQLSFLERNRDT